MEPEGTRESEDSAKTYHHPGGAGTSLDVHYSEEGDGNLWNVSTGGPQLAYLYQTKIESSSEIHIGPTNYYYERKDLPTLDDSCVARVREDAEQYRVFCEEKLQGRFVETRPYLEVRDAVERRSSVLLVGGSGDGKSAILHYIATNPLPDYLHVPVRDPKELRKYIDFVRKSDIKLLFIVDDVVGGSYILHKRVDEWVSLGEYLEMYLDRHKFLLATRKTVWEIAKIHLQKSPFVSFIVEVTSAKLTEHDKRRLLEKYMNSSSQLTDAQKEHIVYNDKPIAFNQCCKLLGDASVKGMTPSELVELFEKPYRFLESELEKMADKDNKCYATLCLIMLSGGELTCAELTGTLNEVTPNVREMILVVWETCGCADPLRVAVKYVQDCAERLIGTFLEKLHSISKYSTGCEVYAFTHDSMHEAVIMRYGVLHFRHCLKYLPPDMVVKISRPSNYERGEHEFVVRVPSDVETSKKLVEVFTDVAIGGNWGMHDVFQNPFVRDKTFQKLWVEHLKIKPDKLSALFLSKSWHGKCVIHLSSWSGSPELCKFLTWNHKCTCGHDTMYPLSVAASNGITEEVRNLMAGKRQNVAEIGQAVTMACESGHIEVIELLLGEIDSARRDYVIEEAMREACRRQRPQTVEYILEKYYTPCRKGRCGCKEGLMVASSRGYRHILRILLSHKDDVNILDNRGRTCIHAAAFNGQTETVQEILNHGADINATDNRGRTCIHYAAMNGHAETVHIVGDLFQLNGGVNAPDVDGMTCLHHAASNGHAQTVQEILNFEADINIRTKANLTALDLAKQGDHRDVEDLLIEHGVDEDTTLSNAAQLNKNWLCMII